MTDDTFFAAKTHPALLLAAALAAAGALGLTAQPGWAQESGSTEGAETAESADGPGSIEELPTAEKKKLLKLVKSARKAYTKGEFGEVVPKMKKAYEIYPDPEFLYRIALSHERSNHTRKALDYYRRYLEEKPESKKRGRIERTIATLEERLASEEEKRAEAEESSPAEDEEASEVQRETTRESTGSQQRRAASSGGNTLAIATLITGGIFTASAGTFGYLNLQQRQKVQNIASDSRSKRRSNTNFDSAVRKQNLYAGITYGSAALAAGAFTWGLLSLSTGNESPQRRSSREKQPQWQVQIGIRRIGVSGRF